MTVAASHHVQIDDAGVAHIDGTRMKVVHLVKEMRARQLTVEQLGASFPDLSPAQIHAALAYYYDHQPQLDEQIRRELADFDAEKSKSPPTPGRDKLRDQGHRP